MTAPSNYRPDIDGLRAVAVVPVVLFHADLNAVSGGFVGVDIFFVISGFLITKIILSDFHKDKFTIANFYERRIRRIFPALFAMMFIYLIVAAWFLLPSDFMTLAESAAATALFISNFYFWTIQSVGYFVATPENHPLIHTWSLAVEEQFYIFYPIVLVALLRYARVWVTPVIVFTLFASFLISIWAVETHPSAAFYLAPARTWELLIGAILALNIVPTINSAHLRNIAGIIGLSMIAWSITTYSADTTPFPGAAALLPCVGAALIIHSGSTGPTLVSRILSWRPMIFIGLISYSLYLWHWPLFAFAKQYYSVAAFQPLDSALVIAAALIISTLSWRFVERPFRSRAKISRKPIFIGGAAAMTVAIAAGIFVTHNAGYPQRFDADIIKLANGENDVSPIASHCESRRSDLCSVGMPEQATTFLLWGDSHAGALIPAIEKASKNTGHNGLIAWRGGCPPLIGVSRITSLEDEILCPDFNDAVLKTIQAPGGPDTIILTARWAVWATGSRYAAENHRLVLIRDASTDRISREENQAVFLRGLRRSLDQLTKANKRIVIVGPVPEVGRKVPSSLAMQQLRGDDTKIEPEYGDFIERQDLVFKTFVDLAKDYEFELVLPHQILCDNNTCKVEAEGRALYQDSNHLSVFGAHSIKHLLEPTMYPQDKLNIFTN